MRTELANKFCRKCSSHHKMPKFLIEHSSEIFWREISRFQKLSELFIEAFSDKVNWREISKNQKLSEEFIEKFKDRVDWRRISSHQKLSENFIRKFSNKVWWKEISESQKLSKEFIIEFIKKINFNRVRMNNKIKLSKEDIEEIRKLKRNFWKNIPLTSQNCETILGDITQLSKKDWVVISKEQKLSKEFIKRFSDKLDLDLVLKNKRNSFSKKFIEEIKNELISEGVNAM